MLLKLTHPVISTGILGTKSRIADIQISSKQIKIHRTAVRLPCPDSGSASLPARVCLHESARGYSACDSLAPMIVALSFSISSSF